MSLDQAQLNALKPEDRARYMSLEHLFAQAGWKAVMALAKQRITEQMQRAALAPSWADNRVAIGAAAAWNEIGNLEEATLAHYQNLLEQAEREALTAQIASEEQFE